MAIGAGSTSRRHIALAAIIVVVVLYAVMAWGGKVVMAVMDNSAVRSAGLRDIDGWWLEATLMRLPRSSRPVDDKHLQRIWELTLESPVDHKAAATLTALDGRHGLHPELVQQVDHYIASGGRSPEALIVLAELARRHPISAAAEAALLAIRDDPSYGSAMQATRALSRIGDRRPFSAATLDRLFAGAMSSQDSERVWAINLLATEAAPAYNPAQLERLKAAVAQYPDARTSAAVLTVLVAQNQADSVWEMLVAPNAQSPATWSAALAAIQASTIAALLELLQSASHDLVDVVVDARLPDSLRQSALHHVPVMGDDALERMLVATPGIESDTIRTLSYHKAAQYGPGRLQANSRVITAVTQGIFDGVHAARIHAWNVVLQSRWAPGDIDAVILPYLESPEPLAEGKPGSARVFPQREVLELLQYVRGPTPAVDRAIDGLRASGDVSIAAMAESAWAFRNTPRPAVDNSWIKDWLGPGFVILLAGVPVAIALVFAVLYVASALALASARSAWLLLAIGVLVIWIGLTLALAYAIVIAVFGFGHGGLSSGLEAAAAIGVYVAVVLIYSGIGWGLHVPLRRSVRERAG